MYMSLLSVVSPTSLLPVFLKQCLVFDWSRCHCFKCMYMHMYINDFILANAAKKEVVPYFPNILEQFKPYLGETADEDTLKVQIQTLGELPRVAADLAH